MTLVRLDSRSRYACACIYMLMMFAQLKLTQRIRAREEITVLGARPRGSLKTNPWPVQTLIISSPPRQGWRVPNRPLCHSRQCCCCRCSSSSSSSSRSNRILLIETPLNLHWPNATHVGGGGMQCRSGARPSRQHPLPWHAVQDNNVCRWEGRRAGHHNLVILWMRLEIKVSQ